MWSINVHLGLLEADVEFLWWWWGGVHSHFRVQPNCSVEVVLCCVVVGVVTIYQWMIPTDRDFPSRISIRCINLIESQMNRGKG